MIQRVKVACVVVIPPVKLEKINAIRIHLLHGLLDVMGDDAVAHRTGIRDKLCQGLKFFVGTRILSELSNQ